MSWSVLPFRVFFATEFFMATVLQLKVAKMRLFEKESLELCMRCGNMSASTSYYWFLLLLLISVVNFLCQSCSLVMQNQLLCDNQVKAALYLKCKLKTYFICHLCYSFVSLQITHMADFHQITSISITRIPLITASPQTDKQKATVSLKVLGAAEVCYMYLSTLPVSTE